MTEFPKTQSRLIAQVRSPEDHEAWETFVHRYRPAIYRMARRRGMQDADAQDLVQAVLARVAGSIGRWEPQGPEVRFRHWLRRVARNAIVSALTRRPGDRPGIGEADAASAQDDELDREIDLEFMRERYQQAAAAVRRKIDALTWAAFEMTAIGGASCEFAAESLDRSIGSVYAARSRVMRRLQEHIRITEEAER